MNNIFTHAKILLPADGTDMQKWCALACDQFTSEPEYWQNAEKLAENAPSTLHITLPEVYLGKDGVDARIEKIHENMREYEKSVLTKSVDGFVLVRRTTKNGARIGVVGAVDLEKYSYEKGAMPLIRPSENTVVDRIPPRLAVRTGAPLEAPHILMLIDDDKKAIIEPLLANADKLNKLYDTDLMLGGGHIEGWAITDKAQIEALEAAVMALSEQKYFDEKYPAAKGQKPLAIAVGDGNHSLATAKAHWENVKKTLSAQEIEKHPARFALVELENIHDEAIEIEPIHRVIFGTDARTFDMEFSAFLSRHGSSVGSGQRFIIVDKKDDRPVHAKNCPAPLAVGTLEMFLTQFCAEHDGVTVDYIHGEDSVRKICAANKAVGVILPDFAKSDLFKGVVLGGVLPKKTFSMGEATEKRYYLECRKIANV